LVDSIIISPTPPAVAPGVHQVPVVREAFLGGVLVHRRDDDAVAQGQAAQGHRGEQQRGAHGVGISSVSPAAGGDARMLAGSDARMVPKRAAGRRVACQIPARRMRTRRPAERWLIG